MNYAREREKVRDLCAKARNELGEMPANGFNEAIDALCDAIELLTAVSEQQETELTQLLVTAGVA